MAHIKAYARIKPTQKASHYYDWNEQKVCLSLPNQPGLGAQQLRRETTINHDFDFACVFGVKATQQEVFDVVASNIVKGFLGGYNGTIFAYGQTGSGKTYTIEGAAQRYGDRGLAPRALSLVYKLLESSNYEHTSIHVSYLEIYQEVGYDLLNPTTRPGNVVAHLPKVTVIDGSRNTCIIRNLSTHLAADERVAQSLFLQGQTNRKVAETPSNQRSSRSHAVFTIYLTAKEKDSDAITRSKLHLVDLAGSERVAKTKIKGKRLGEAKFINLSLHHLESVIIALQKGTKDSVSNRARGSRTRGSRQRSQSAGPIRSKMRIGSATSMRSLPYARSASLQDLTHPRYIPYRNSLLTMVLKDSLGGNCLTAMIATLSIEDVNIGETLSTCRFAMRVVCIENHASRNETLDDKTVIKRLRKRVTALEDEVTRLRHGQDKGDYSQKQITDHHPDKTVFTQSTHKPIISEVMSKVSRLPGSDVTVSTKTVSNQDRSQCVKVMHGFIGGRIKDPLSAGINDIPKLQECLHLLKKMILQSYAGQRQADTKSYSQHPNDSKETAQYISTNPNRSRHNRIKSAPNIISGRSNQRVISTYGQIPAYVTQRKTSRRDGKGSTASLSPLEKRRDKDIDKMTNRVDRKRQDLSVQRKSLMEFQASLKEQQLGILEYELRLKVTSAQDQVRKQGNVISKLMKSGADRDEVLMEKMVEKQLIKRLDKYERRLQNVRDQLQIIENHHQLQKRSTSNKSGTDPEADKMAGVAMVTSKVDHLHHRKPKTERTNSRRVLDTLQKEERKQEKIQTKINEERLLAVADHMEMKEASTMHKLREFRAKLNTQQTDAYKSSPPDSHKTGDGSQNTDLIKQSLRGSNVVSQKETLMGRDEAHSDHMVSSWNSHGDHMVNGDSFATMSSRNGRTDKSQQKITDDKRTVVAPRFRTEERESKIAWNSKEELGKQEETLLSLSDNDEHHPILTSTPLAEKKHATSNAIPKQSDLNISEEYCHRPRYFNSPKIKDTNGEEIQHKPLPARPEAASKLPFNNFREDKDVISQVNSMPSGSLHSKSTESFNSSLSTSTITNTHHGIQYTTRQKPQSDTSDIGSMFSLDSKSFDSALSSMLQEDPPSFAESPSSSRIWNSSVKSRPSTGASLYSSRQSSMDSYDWKTSIKLSNNRGDAYKPANGIGASMTSLSSKTTVASSTSGSSESKALLLKDKLTQYVSSSKSPAAHTRSLNMGMPSPRTNMTPAMDQWSINSKSSQFCSPSMETLSSVYTTTSAATSQSADTLSLQDGHRYGLANFDENKLEQTSSNDDKLVNSGLNSYPDSEPFQAFSERASDSWKDDNIVPPETSGLMSSQFIDSTDGREVNYREPPASLGEDERESTYIRVAKENKQRVAKMRKAMTAAETIQKAWRNYQDKK